MLQPTIIKGGSFHDSRGTLRFINDFDMAQIRRAYIIEHPNTDIVRAWLGHRKEQKWFYVLDGSFDVHLVQPDDWTNPSNDLPLISHKLSADNNEILHVPCGYANGFRALQDNSKLFVFSDFTMEQSAGDNYRFRFDLWFDWGKLDR